MDSTRKKMFEQYDKLKNMTGRTHDLAAFTALTFIVATQPIGPMTLPTALTAVSANFIGGLAPDLDQPTARLWRNIRGGSIIAKLLTPLLGGHRFISHSVLGIFLFGFIADQVLKISSTFFIVDHDIVWWSFMIGFLSHLIMDTFTHEGVPWLFPIPIRWGIPPLSFLRIKTGGLLEKTFVFPGLLLINAYLFYTYYLKFLEFLKSYIK